MQGQGLKLTRGSVHIVRFLGNGGTGMVYLARLVGINGVGRDVVIKQAREGAYAYEQCLNDEAHLLGILQGHPRIIAVLDHGHRELEGGITVPYLMLEYGGVPLSAVKHACGGSIEPGLGTHIALEVLRALAWAHAHEIVHRDIKPANVLISRHGEVKLIDFGIAKASIIRQATTEVKTVKGTTSYLAPEMVRQEKLDGRADLWGVGVMLYEMLSGRLPWISNQESDNDYKNEIKRLIVSEPPPPLPESVPMALAAIVFRFLEKKREDRYADANEAIKALLEAGTSLPAQVAEIELGQHAQAAEQPLSRNNSPDSSSVTVPVSADKRAPQSLVAYRLPSSNSSMEVSMSSDEISLSSNSDESWTSNSGDARSLRVRNARAEVETTDVVAESPAQPATNKRRVSWPAVAALVLMAITGGAFTVRGTRGAQAESLAPARQRLVTVSKPPATGTPSASRTPSGSPIAVAPAAPLAGRPSSAPVPETLERSVSHTAGKASLSVVVVPAGSYVSLDGRSPVHAPSQFANLRAGRHVLRAGSGRGKLSQERQVQLSEGTNSVRIELLTQPAGPNPFEE